MVNINLKFRIMVRISALTCLFLLTVYGLAAQSKPDTLLIDPDNYIISDETENELTGKEEISESLSVNNSNTDFVNETGYLLYQFEIPCNGRVLSRFGIRHGRLHAGIDLKMQKGDTIYAVYDGIVSRRKYYHGYGNLVVLNHGNRIETYYGHMSGFIIQLNDTIRKGEAIELTGATSRATASHLHFEIRENKKPYNPELIFDFETRKVKDNI